MHAAGPVYMPPDRSWTHANLSKSAVTANGARPADGDTATGVVVTTEVLLENVATVPAVGVGVTANIVDTAGSGAVVAIAKAGAPITVDAAGQHPSSTLVAS